MERRVPFKEVSGKPGSPTQTQGGSGSPEAMRRIKASFRHPARQPQKTRQRSDLTAYRRRFLSLILSVAESQHGGF